MDFESNSRETTKWRFAATAADALVIGSLLWSSTIGRLQPYRLNRPHYKESRDDDQQYIAMDLALGIASITDLVRWRICFGLKPRSATAALNSRHAIIRERSD
jgi:hypothetical protein